MLRRSEAAARESNEVRADTEARALARRRADRGRDDIEDGENGRGDHAERNDLIPGERAAGHEDGRDGHEEALNEVLDNAIHDL